LRESKKTETRNRWQKVLFERQQNAEERAIASFARWLQCITRSRAYWKGFLRLSLVSIGVHVHNAVESKAAIAFRQIHKTTGRRVNYQNIALRAARVG
jgi:hypothetical protein